MNSSVFLLCDLAAKSALLALLGLGLASLTRRAASWRALALTCTLVAIAVLPALRLVAPKIALPWPVPAPAKATTPARALEPLGHAAPSFGTRSTAALTPNIAACIWALGAIGVAAYFGLGYIALRQWKRRTIESTQQTDVQNAANELAITRRVTLLESAECHVPVTWGWLRPIVLLPTTADKWPSALRRQVLLHELAHVRRADWLVQMLIQAICAVYWWNPFVWLCARKWAAACEQACDDLVLSRGIAPSEYAENLLALAKVFSGTSQAASLALTQALHLEGRIRSILSPAARRETASRSGAVMLAAGLLLTGATTAGLTELPAAAENTSPNSASTIAKNDALTYVVDLKADHTAMSTDGIATAEGNAILATEKGVMKADRIKYNAVTHTAVGKGHVTCKSESFTINSTTIMTIRLNKSSIAVDGADQPALKSQTKSADAHQQN